MTKAEIKEYAKDLFLTVNEIGNHKYSFREISHLISQKFKREKIKVSYRTIKVWADNEGWENLFQDSKNLGIEKAIIHSKKEEEKEQSKRKTKEEQIKDIKSDEVAKIFQDLKSVFTACNEEFNERKKTEALFQSYQIPKGQILIYTPTKDLVKTMLDTFDRMKDFLDIKNSSEEKTDLIIEVKRKKADE